MGLLKRFLIERAARRDAEHSLDSADPRITRELGLRPALEPALRHDHAQVVADLNRRVEEEEWTEDLRRAEEEAARYHPPFVFLLGLVLALLVELKGAVLVMKGFDVPSSERLAYGAALAFGLIALTALLTKVTPQRAVRGADGQPSSAPAASRLVPAVYTLLILALTVMRLHGADDELSQTERYSQAIVMIVATVGPAWTAEWLLRRYGPVRHLAREIKLLKGRIREAKKARRRAERFTAGLARRGAQYDEAAARLRAGYQIEHRLAAAELPEEQPEPAVATRRRGRKAS